MQGKAVLSPIGFDSFGLPAENAAIKTGTHPRIFTEARIAELKSSLIRLGAVYDWRREVRSHDPEYITWNQMIFLRLWDAGLAYRADGARSTGAPAARRSWPTSRSCPTAPVSAPATSWSSGTSSSGSSGSRSTPTSCSTPSTTSSGPSGSRSCSATGSGAPRGPSSTSSSRADPTCGVRVFTTRPDTSFGMTYAVVAPEHPLVDELTTDDQRDEVEELRRRAAEESEIERMAEGDASALDKRGAFTGSNVINPFTGGPVPVYVADYVLMGYGTGAIMAVPAEDERDWDVRHASRPPHRPHRPAARRLGGVRRRCLHG